LPDGALRDGVCDHFGGMSGMSCFLLANKGKLKAGLQVFKPDVRIPMHCSELRCHAAASQID
jgi:hypothetical protein